MVKLYQFTQSESGPNYSPYCAKVETYLKMAGIPYELHMIRDPAKSPKGKLPYIQDGSTIVADSSFIIEYLKGKYGDGVDSHLNREQRAVSVAFQRLIEENSVLAMLKFRWTEPNGYRVFTARALGELPGFLAPLVAKMLRKKIVTWLHYQGMGRHSHEEVLAIAGRDFSALSDFLGERPFFFNDRPSTLDAILFALSTNILRLTSQSPICAKFESYPNLVAHNQRMKAMFWESQRQVEKRAA